MRRRKSTPAADLGRISPWNSAIAERHAVSTERMLLGECGPPQVVSLARSDAAPPNLERDEVPLPAGRRSTAK